MKPIFRIISFTGKFWKWYLFMGVAVILLAVFSLIVPFISKQIVDLIVARFSGKEVDVQTVILLLSGIIATDIAISTMTSFSQWIGDLLSVRLQTYLSYRFYKHILGLHVGYYDNEITGRIVNKMYRGITSITDFIQSMLNNFLPFFLTALVTIIILSYYSPFIGILLFILFPLYIIISHGSTISWQKYEEEKNKLNDMSQGRVYESIAGIRVVKSFVSEIIELSGFAKNRKGIEMISKTQTKKWHLFDYLRRLILNIILFAIYAYVIYFTFHGRYTIGEMTLLLQLVNQARFPLFAMSFILGQIQRASAGSADFFSILETKPEIKDKANARILDIGYKVVKKAKPLIEFNNITFKYNQGKPVLHDISFPVFPREKLALVGESGEGKSTVINLLLRYYEAQKGHIMIGGMDISEVTQESLHKNIAVVFQESLLFSGTVYENISYGSPRPTMEKVIACAKAANAYTFIEELPQKFQSMVGERGVKLSGGQKQRIAIARAILKDAPIIILDEATSSLDSKAELEVQKGLDNLLKNRTSIIIAHRLSTIANADHILVLAGGEIAQYGKASDLVRDKKGLYAQLISLQKQLLSAPSEERRSKLEKFGLVG